MDHPISQPESNEQYQTGEVDSAIARQLTGELFCIGCGYNLRGLSIRANCSECGMPVRATILGIVDPHADELVPLSAPKISALGLNAWSFGAMLAILAVWLMRGAEVARDMLGSTWAPEYFTWIGIAGLGLSMLGAATLIRPHRGVTRGEAIGAALGVSLYAPLIYVYSTIYQPDGLFTASPMLRAGESDFERSVLHVLLFVLIAGIIWLLRKQAVGLAVRSVVVRTGRVDRQSLLTVLASLGLAAAGDLIKIIAEFSSGLNDVLSIVAVVIIALGSVLFTAGMINICIDTVRLYPVLVRPGVGLSDIFETNQQRSDRLG
tara:strand:+ start:127283 stop:128242 length:960 start_codon:yes stop_codon:yes gene_type:complete